jgi:hypothetical protein
MTDMERNEARDALAAAKRMHEVALDEAANRGAALAAAEARIRQLSEAFDDAQQEPRRLLKVLAAAEAERDALKAAVDEIARAFVEIPEITHRISSALRRALSVEAAGTEPRYDGSRQEGGTTNAEMDAARRSYEAFEAEGEGGHG